MLKKINFNKIISVVVAMILLLMLCFTPISTFATDEKPTNVQGTEVYYNLITDRSAYLTSIEKNYLLSGANSLIFNGNTYVYLYIENENFGKNIYNIMFNTYNQLYTVHNASDQVVVLYYYIADSEYEHGHLYYYDGEYGYLSEEELEKININLSKYNSRNNINEGLKYAYNNVINIIADNENIPLHNFDTIPSNYGSVNLAVVPSILIILIMITAIFAFRKR